jgi:uncharacterized protein YraI
MNRSFKGKMLWWWSRRIAVWLFVTVIVCADVAVAEQHHDVIGVVTTQQTPLNLRNGPGTHASILATLPRGEFVVIAETVDAWYQIHTRVKNEVLTGYVSRRYITVLPTMTDVYRTSDGTISLHGTFPKNTPVLLLSSGQKGASQVTTTQDAYSLEFTPEIIFDLTHLDMQTPTESVFAAIVGKEAATYQYAYLPLTDADDAVKARFAHAWHHDQCADIAHDAESVPFG